MDHVVLVLKRTFNEKKLAASDDEPVLVVKIGRDNDIGDASFVLYRNENESLGLGRARPLPGDDAADHARQLGEDKACTRTPPN